MKYSRQSEESRREWMLWMFERAGEKKNSNVREKQFGNKTINNRNLSLKVFEQKNKLHS
jgi:hypothetical protein